MDTSYTASIVAQCTGTEKAIFNLSKCTKIRRFQYWISKIFRGYPSDLHTGWVTASLPRPHPNPQNSENL